MAKKNHSYNVDVNLWDKMILIMDNPKKEMSHTGTLSPFPHSLFFPFNLFFFSPKSSPSNWSFSFPSLNKLSTQKRRQNLSKALGPPFFFYPFLPSFPKPFFSSFFFCSQPVSKLRERAKLSFFPSSTLFFLKNKCSQSLYPRERGLMCPLTARQHRHHNGCIFELVCLLENGFHVDRWRFDLMETRMGKESRRDWSLGKEERQSA